MPLRLPARRHKYGAKPCVIQGHRFASQKEGARFVELSMLEKAGKIRNLELQPKFDLLVPTPDGSKVKVGSYRADFRYEVPLEHYYILPADDRVDTTCFGAVTVIEDVKAPATRTTAYRLRKRMVEATYAVVIREV